MALLAAAAAILSGESRAEDCDGNGVEDAVEIAAGGPVLLQGVTFRTSVPVDSPVLAEVDGDEALDLLGVMDGELVVHSGRGGRFPDPVVRSRVEAGALLAPGDLDLDGDTDLVAASSSGLLFLANDGQGRFSATSIAEGRFSGGALLDVDGDGRQDLVSIRRAPAGEPPEITAIIMEAVGPRIAQAVPAAPDSFQLVAADIDGDSDRDLAVAGVQSLTLYENAGGALVRKRTLPFSIGTIIPLKLETARIHASMDDVVIHSSEALLLWGGGGWDQDLRDLKTYAGFSSSAFADFDRDGLDDLVSVTYGEVFVSRNNGTSSFGAFPMPACAPVSTARRARQVLEGDLDGDGFPDLILDFRTDWTVFFAIRQGDADGNGRLDACDPDCDSSGVPDAVEVARGDLNGNGFPDACDPDCDADGIPDDSAIAMGLEKDCDGNSIPDACEPELPFRPDEECGPGPDAAMDCDGNGVHDTDDVRPRTALWPLSLDRGGLADLDGDGDLDLLGQTDSFYLQFSRNHGKGVFLPEWRARLSSGLRISAADIDGDGNLDWTAAAQVGWPCRTNGAVRTFIFLGDGKGGYRRRFVKDLAESALVHLNRDGLADLAGFQDGKLQVHLGRGDGTFVRSASLVVSGTRVAAADIDGDGDQDLYTDLGQLLLNTGSGGLAPGPGLPPNPLELADFDGNGLLDIASPNGVHLQVARGEFRAGAAFDPPVIAIEASDVDGDAHVDLVCVVQGGRLYQVLRNTGTGLAAPVEQRIRFEADGIAASDLDGDSFPELLLDRAGSEVRTAFRNDGTGEHGEKLVGPAGFVESMAVADMDADGDGDLLALESDEANRSSQLRTFVNDGQGRFAPGDAFPLGGAIWQMLVAELDGDALPDVLVVVDQELRLLRNEGDGFPVVWQTAGRTGGVLLEDVDGDGRTDIVAPPRIHRNAGGGVFLSRDFRPRYQYLADGMDVDGDSDLDLIVGDGREIVLLENDGTGTFGGARLLAATGSTYQVAAGDYDGDGDPDLAVSGAPDPGFPDEQSLFFYLNDGAGNFIRGISFTGVLHSFEAVDLDRDGREELLRFAKEKLEIFRLDGRGSLETQAWHSPVDSSIFALGDIEGDRALEIVLRFQGSLLVVQSSLSPSPADADLDGIPDACGGAGFLRGDWNGDLVLGITDPIALLDHLFRGGEPSRCPRAGDADDSGVLDLTDAVRVLLHLFLGGEPPPAPFPSCGRDPSPDVLGCGSPPCA